MIFAAEPRLPPELEVVPLLDVEPDEVLLVVPLLLEVELDDVLPSVGVVPPPPPQARSRTGIAEINPTVLKNDALIENLL
ncbi:MAG: hypothetical protein KJ634_06075 [Gammaproteobacteria bacterium]|nr:hypothetical protein [Gammaproteobacteria bacterium]MBU1415172.1 hypothetical protein [Gammaproteobacteria bacterium]